jgi:CheY-like chemotaxis protein
MRPRSIEIVLAEDNDDDLFLVQDAFRASTLSRIVHAAVDGEAVLDYLRGRATGLPDLLLLDINMPRKDGFEVLQEIKRDPALWHLPVVMLSTSLRADDVALAYSMGACSYITKPPDVDRLAEIVAQLERYWALVSRPAGAVGATGAPRAPSSAAPAAAD